MWVCALAGCSSGPLDSDDVYEGLEDGYIVTWVSENPAMGSVRWGSKSGEYTRTSYPSAEGRQDKTLLTEHRVPLLTARAGEPVYLQTLSRSECGTVTVGEEAKVRVTRAGPRPPLLVWTMIDVGFGDAHLLTMPTTGTTVLIDAGERRDWPNVDTFLTDSDVQTIDVVLGTHVHVDHLGGMVGETDDESDGVLAVYDVGVFLDTPSKSAPRAAYDEVLGLLAARGVRVDTVRVGDTDRTHPDLAWDPAVEVRVLNSGGGESIGGESDSDHLNNDSVVLHLGYGDVGLLLGGDAEAPVEYRLETRHGAWLSAEILKVHHHGVNDASIGTFLDAVDPRVALIPVVSYETYFESIPGSTLLSRFSDRNIDVFASDRAGPLGVLLTGDRGHHVTVVTDGSSYEVLVDASLSRHYPGIPGAAIECLEGP